MYHFKTEAHYINPYVAQFLSVMGY